jgi:hypothetical protein
VCLVTTKGVSESRGQEIPETSNCDDHHVQFSLTYDLSISLEAWHAGKDTKDPKSGQKTHRDKQLSKRYCPLSRRASARVLPASLYLIVIYIQK